MKSINKELLESLEQSNIKLAKCLKITLTNGKELLFTEYCEDLVVEGAVYKSTGGFDENKNQQYLDITPNNEEIVTFIENNDIKKEDILTGTFDNAEVEVFYVNYKHIEYGKIPITNGFVDGINFIDDKVYFNISGIISLLEKTIGETYSPLCRASFCDKKCSLNKENYLFYGKIDQIISNTEFICSGDNIIDKESNYFKYGTIKFISGKNKDKVGEIKRSDKNTLTLSTKLFYSLNVDDEFEITAGCDKKFSTCIEKFNNAINFRGEPNLPRTTKVYKFY